MNIQDLTERYIYAVVKHLPAGMRQELEKELAGLIDDMLRERCGEVPPTEKDLRVVLAELGAPEELANNYSPDKDKSLIGPPYYSKYKTVLKIVLLAAAAGMMIAGALEIMTKYSGVRLTAEELFTEIAQWLGMTFGGVIYAFAFVTAVFAFFQWRGIPLSQLTESSYESLPRPPKKQECIKKGETVGDMVISVLFLIVFVFAPQVICAVFTVNGVRQVMPVLNVEVVQSLWYFTVSFAMIGMVRDFCKYWEGRYNTRVLWVTAVCDALSLILSVFWLTGHELMNPQFLASIDSIFTDGNQFIQSFFGNFQFFFLGLLIFALALDFGDTLYKVVRYGGGTK